MSDERRRKRKELRLVKNEATWLQKALFALGKAEVAREKLAEFQGVEPEGWVLDLGGDEVAVEDVEQALENRVQGLLDRVKERRQSIR